MASIQWTAQSDSILSCFWLRPYSALIRIIEEQLLGLEVKGNSLDLACGDGVFSALAKGGSFSKNFCVYKDIGSFNTV